MHSVPDTLDVFSIVDPVYLKIGNAIRYPYSYQTLWAVKPCPSNFMELSLLILIFFLHLKHLTTASQLNLALLARSGTNSTGSEANSNVGSDAGPSLKPASKRILEQEVAARNGYINLYKAEFRRSNIGIDYMAAFHELAKIPSLKVTNCGCLGLGNIDYRPDDRPNESNLQARTMEQLAAFEVLVEVLSAYSEQRGRQVQAHGMQAKNTTSRQRKYTSRMPCPKIWTTPFSNLEVSPSYPTTPRPAVPRCSS